MTPPKCSVLDWLKLLAKSSKRQLDGDEYDQVWLLLLLAEPIHSYDNQHCYTDQYLIGETRYDVIYFADSDAPIIEEYEE